MFVSQYLQAIPYGDDFYIIWHAVFGCPTLCLHDLVDKLLAAKARRSKVDPWSLMSDDWPAADKAAAIDDLVKMHILIDSRSQGFADMYDLHLNYDRAGANKVRYLSLIMSEECNFRCRYCIHFANAAHQFNPAKLMTEEVARASIDQYLRMVSANQLDYAYINFGGGEPLLNWSVMAKLLEYIDEQRAVYPVPIQISLNSNLSLVSDEIAATLARYDVAVAGSLDGFQSGNDIVRLTKSLGGTYSQIVAGFQALARAGKPLDGFAMTVTEANFSDVSEEIIDWAQSQGMHEVRIDIDVVGTVQIPVETLVQRLSKVRRYAKTKGVKVIGFWSRPAENMSLDPARNDVGFCGAERGNSLCVAPSGQVFPCGYSNYLLGDYRQLHKIYQLPPYQRLLQQRWMPRRCRGCEIVGFCRGGCMITQEASGSNVAQDRMCEFYRAMTHALMREAVDEQIGEGGE